MKGLASASRWRATGRPCHDRWVDAQEIEDEARAALAPVLRDVAATTDVKISIEHTTYDDGEPAVKVSAPPGVSAVWIRIHDYDDPQERMAIATDAIQEFVIEELWRHGSNWPVCTLHPTTHPMEVRWMSDGPCWSCPVDSSVAVDIGSLKL